MFCIETYKMIFSLLIFDIIPFIARLFDSVAPEVKTISSLSAPISFAISVLAFSISLNNRMIMPCMLRVRVIIFSSKKWKHFFNTLLSTGVVEWLSNKSY